jgi:hypothetical protein
MKSRISAFVACVLSAVVVLTLSGVASADTVDPDQAAKLAADINLSLRAVGGDVYDLTVENQSGIGSIDGFAWVPGPGWTVTSVVRSPQHGCTVSSGAISCHVKIAPPKRCTCLPGGQMTIRFTMIGPKPKAKQGEGRLVSGTGGGYIIVRTVTRTGRHIPTALPGV